MLAERKEEYDYDYDYNYDYEGALYEELPEPSKPQLTVIPPRPRTLLNTRLRSRCQVMFLVIAAFAMAVTVRSGISASRGYALVAVQQQAQQLEQENERLRVEIAKLKSPQRIQAIAAQELGMEVPKKMYFSHER